MGHNGNHSPVFPDSSINLYQLRHAQKPREPTHTTTTPTYFFKDGRGATNTTGFAWNLAAILGSAMLATILALAYKQREVVPLQGGSLFLKPLLFCERLLLLVVVAISGGNRFSTSPRLSDARRRSATKQQTLFGDCIEVFPLGGLSPQKGSKPLRPCVKPPIVFKNGYSRQEFREPKPRSARRQSLPAGFPGLDASSVHHDTDAFISEVEPVKPSRWEQEQMDLAELHLNDEAEYRQYDEYDDTELPEWQDDDSEDEGETEVDVEDSGEEPRAERPLSGIAMEGLMVGSTPRKFLILPRAEVEPAMWTVVGEAKPRSLWGDDRFLQFGVARSQTCL